MATKFGGTRENVTAQGTSGAAQGRDMAMMVLVVVAMVLCTVVYFLTSKYLFRVFEVALPASNDREV